MKNCPYKQYQRIVTRVTLFVLLLTRFPFYGYGLFLEKFLKPSVFSIDLESLRLLQNHFILFFWRYSFILIAIVIINNTDRLNKLNLDKSFILIFLCGGLAYTGNLDWYYSDWQIGLVTGITSLFVFILGIKGVFKSGDEGPNWTPAVLVLTIGFFLVVLCVSNPWVIQGFLSNIPIVIVEEVLFRGMLWMFLKDLNFSDLKIVVVQAILFWFYHVGVTNSLVDFWVILPIESVLFGLVVWKSRSITPGVFAHLLANVLTNFY